MFSVSFLTFDVFAFSWLPRRALNSNYLQDTDIKKLPKNHETNLKSMKNEKHQTSQFDRQKQNNTTRST
jgi:hypothetical protein